MLNQSGPGSNGKEDILHISQSFKTGTSPSDSLVSYPGHLCRDAIGIFYSPHQLGFHHIWDSMTEVISMVETKLTNVKQTILFYIVTEK